MANTSFKAENGLSVTGNAQFDYTSKFNANVTIAADQWYIGGNLYVTGTQVFVGGNAAVADILAGASGLKIGNTTNQFDAYLSNVFVYGLLNPVGNTILLGNSTNRWVISGNTLNISTTSTLTGAATLANTIAVTGAATLANTLGVTGATTLSNTMSVTGAANALSTFGVTGATTLTGAANALSTFGVTGATTLTGAANALSTFGVTGVATFANTTSHVGAATFSNTLAVTGTTTLTGNATLSGALQTISGNAAFNSSTLFVDATNNRVGIGTTGPATTLTVQGTFNANGAATLSNTSAHTGSATFANTIAVTGATTLSNTLAVTGTTTFNNDVTINANLTVTGTRTYVNTQTLDISDNIITLNADLPGASPPTENAGIEINRGSSANSRLQWNESSDTWQITADGTNFFNILSDGTTNTNFDSGTLFIDALNNRVGINNTAPGVALRVTGNADISGTANIQSNANVGGTLGIAGLTTAAAGLAVTGTANIFGGGGAVTTARFATGAFPASGISIVPNATAGTLNSLVAAGDILLNFSSGGVGSGNLVIANWATNTGGIKINGLINDIALVGNSFTFTTGNSNFDSGVLFVDALNNRVGINNTAPGVALRVTGAVDISSTANIQGNANVGGTLGVASLLTASALNVTNQTNTATLFVTTSANVGTAFTANSTLTNAIALNVVNQTNTATLFVTTSANVGTAFTANSTLTNAIALNVVNQTNTATLFVTTSANVGTALTINTTELTVAPNANFDSGTLFVDAVNNRVGINNTAPGVALRVTGEVDISSTANIQGNANVGGTLGIAGLTTAAAGLTVTGTSNVSAQFNVGGGVATTNGATITNTSIRVGNSSVNTQISPTQIIVDTNDGDGSTTVTGNLIVVFTSSGTANLSSTTLTIGTTTVNNSQVNSALYTAGLFGVTNGATINATSIRIGNTTSNAIVSGNLISISNTANLTSTTLTIGTTTVTTALINTAALNVVNQTNTATLFVTTSANVGTALTVNSSVINAAANLSMGAYTEKMTALAITTNGTTDLNLQTSSVFRVTVANTVVTSANVRFINPPATGTAVSATLILQYLGTGANSIGALAIQGNTQAGAAGTMKYAYNTAPTLTLSPAKSDILSVITYDGGSSYIVAPSFMNFTT